VNGYDRLLAWASERGSGTWSQWRAACEYLDLEPTTSARNLSALGHVELDWVDNRFACAPVTAALIQRSSGSAIVTGTRRRDFRSRLRHTCEETARDVWLHPAVPQPDGPETWLLELEIREADAFCAEAGMQLAIDPGRRILKRTPPATLETAAEPDVPMDRFVRQWVDPRTRQPVYDVPDDREGLWYVREQRRNIAFLRRAAGWYRVPVREYGIYLAYPDQVFIRHDRADWRLLVDVDAPLPPLLARAATLQSGRLPARRGRSDAYENISATVAEEIAGRLNAKLETTGQ
jgi:hypothetical protein